MDVKELKARKQKLEQDIAVATNRLLEAFEEETALTPHEIDVNMVRDDVIRSKPSVRHFLADVEVKIEI